MPDARTLAIVGGGIAGLCAAVYAQKSGYQTEVFEMNETPGGLATNWRRGEYTFETCLHWLLGSNPASAMYERWREVLDIDRLRFIDPQEYVRIEAEGAEPLSIYADPDRLEAELLKHAPQDAEEIHHFVSAVRKFAAFELPDAIEPSYRRWLTYIRELPELGLFRHWSNITVQDYGRRFTHPLLRSFFGDGDSAQMSAIAVTCSLGWMCARNAGYPIGGSQAIIRAIVEEFLRNGGSLRLGAKVEATTTKNGFATGVRLDGGETVPADWVISAADGHATIYELLGGRYTDQRTDRIYQELKTFSSYAQVSLGVARDLSQQPGFLIRVLDAPLTVDPGTELSQIAFRIFHYDPTFAPPGKTAVTCVLPTRNFEFWTNLQQQDLDRYHAEKDRLAEAVIAVLEKVVPGSREAVEITDVSTPATVIRYTGNWKGSMEGWLPTPDTPFRPLRMTLPGLEQFMMVGQWVMPGGGLPTGLLTARSAIHEICRADERPFLPGRPLARSQRAGRHHG